jgi:transposase
MNPISENLDIEPMNNIEAIAKRLNHIYRIPTTYKNKGIDKTRNKLNNYHCADKSNKINEIKKLIEQSEQATKKISKHRLQNKTCRLISLTASFCNPQATNPTIAQT